MITLTDRLHGLADDAPDGTGRSAIDEPGLWVRGKRLQRRRRVVTASLAAALVLGIGSLTTVVVDQRTYSLPVADAEAPLGLPDQIYAPSPRTPGTDETGPIGPLVAVVGGYRPTGEGESTPGIAGVSGAGAYAFLDLQGLASTEMASAGPLALSPNGRWIAYYVTGPTSGEAYRGAGDPVVGVALLDTVTGSTRRELIATEHGLSVDDLTWVGSTVLTEYGQIDAISEPGYDATVVGYLSWDAASGVVDPAATSASYPDLHDSTPGPAGTVVTRNGRCGYSTMSPDGSTRDDASLDLRCEGGVFLSPDGRRVASTEDVDGPTVQTSRKSPIVVGDVTGSKAVIAQELAGDDEELSDQVIGWRDDDHLIVTASSDEGGLRRYLSVDVDTGERQQLLAMPSIGTMTTQVASDALTGPRFSAPEPDVPRDPRIAYGLGAIVVLLGGSLLWRHRVHA